MKKEKKEIEKELEKNLRMAFINGFVLSPKIISKMLSKKDKWCSMLPIFVLVSTFFFFTVFGRERAGAIYLGPFYTKS